MKTAQRNSAAAAEYARKKKEQLQRANQMRAERERAQVPSSVFNTERTAEAMTSATPTQQLISTYASLEGPSMEPVAEHIRISRKHYQRLDDNQMRQNAARDRQRIEASMKQLKPARSTNIGNPRVTASTVINESYSLSQPRTCSNHHSDSAEFIVPPVDPAGSQFDVSDRPLLCLSSNMRNEVVVGSADHALYAIDINASSKYSKPITMYNKTNGHTDWITGVAHLPNGKVISSSMDGKLCLWDTSRRRCDDLFGHEGSIVKVVADTVHNVALSLGYDGNVLLWSFPDSSSTSKRTGRTSAYTPAAVLTGHDCPVLECSYTGGRLASGGKDGGLILWACETGEIVARYRAHKAPVTAVEPVGTTGMFLTGGADGYVKVWDSRERNAVQRIPAHTQKQPGREYSAAVACMSTNAAGRGGGQLGYITTGGADSALVVIDPRGGSGSYSIVDRHEHHQNGIYSLCSIGSHSVASGDGMGMMLVYDLTCSGRDALKYGLGASGSGAVRAITCVDGKIVACGEDGKTLVYKY